jgi:hypothetical protein
MSVVVLPCRFRRVRPRALAEAAAEALAGLRGKGAQPFRVPVTRRARRAAA